MQTMTMSVVVSVLLGWIPLLTTGPMAIAAQSDLVTAIAYDYTKLYEKVSPGVFKIEVDKRPWVGVPDRSSGSYCHKPSCRGQHPFSCG